MDFLVYLIRIIEPRLFFSRVKRSISQSFKDITFEDIKIEDI